MFALARRIGFGLLTTTLVMSTAHLAMAKPWPTPWPKPWPHYYHHGPAIIVNPVVVSPVIPVAAEIQLLNPNPVPLKYTLNGGPVQLLPAGSSVAINQESVIAFDRGGAAGWNRYTLTCGVYKFIPAGGAWTLVRDTGGSVADGTIISAANPVPAN